MTLRRLLTGGLPPPLWTAAPLIPRSPRPNPVPQDNTTFVHIAKYTDGRTSLSSVGVFLAGAPPGGAPPGPLPVAATSPNALLAATNATLVPGLLAGAGIAQAAPLLVYVASNVSLGAHPPLPLGGIAVRRPVVLVGLASRPTSVDFEMVVNQLNASTSTWARVTFVELILENLAPVRAAGREGGHGAAAGGGGTRRDAPDERHATNGAAAAAVSVGVAS